MELLVTLDHLPAWNLAITIADENTCLYDMLRYLFEIYSAESIDTFILVNISRLLLLDY